MSNNTKYKKEALKLQISLMHDIIKAKLSLLISISLISAALLVVASFGGNIIEVNSFVRTLLSAILFLIWLNLLSYLLEVTVGERRNRKQIEEITGLNINEEIKKIRNKEPWFLQKILNWNSWMPWISFLIFSAILFAIIILISQPLFG